MALLFLCAGLEGHPNVIRQTTVSLLHPVNPFLQAAKLDTDVIRPASFLNPLNNMLNNHQNSTSFYLTVCRLHSIFLSPKFTYMSDQKLFNDLLKNNVMFKVPETQVFIYHMSLGNDNFFLSHLVYLCLEDLQIC